MRKYFYSLIRKHLSIFVTDEDLLAEVEPCSRDLLSQFPGAFAVSRRPLADGQPASSFDAIESRRPDWILLGGSIHYDPDIESLLRDLHRHCSRDSRLILTYYSGLWRPLFRLASALGIRGRLPESNWLAHGDVENLLLLSGFERVRLDSGILFPVRIPFLSDFVNRFLAPLPGLRQLAMVNFLVARPRPANGRDSEEPSVSVVVPARNEAGNIAALVERTPLMGPHDELIFVEGNSTDDTWQAILAAQEKYGSSRTIVAARQDGKGKGDAVRKGFSLARNDVFMILDADMTVPPEDLPRFYRVIRSGMGEFVNGSRLVYPMEGKAMRFLNMLGNRFFASAFSFVLGQRFRDTLCGTKVISSSHYRKLQARRSYFGLDDPFGDFDLIFGAARLCLKIVEVPITYRQRTYGDTNISRFTHGALLLRMLQFAARKIKFV